jgi:hypothetical protein
MDQNTAQYVSVSTKNDPFQEEVIPTHRAIPRKDILYWDLIPLWRPQDKFTPQQRIYNPGVEAIPDVVLSFRQFRMMNYLQSDEPMWGRNVVQILDDPDAWDNDQYPPAPKKAQSNSSIFRRQQHGILSQQIVGDVLRRLLAICGESTSVNFGSVGSKFL